jgi:hypothetical protein
MPSHYSVIRYVPDSVTDERINVGVIAVGDGGTHARFLAHWHRVREFGAPDLRFLHEFARELELRRDPRLNGGRDWNHDELMRLASGWTNSIQFSEPRASLKTSAELIEEVAVRFLRDEAAPAQAYRARSQAIELALSKAKAALRNRFGVRGAALVNKRVPLQGAVYSHHFDLVIGNDQPYFAGQMLSLELPDQRRVEKDIDAAGWTIQDLRQYAPDLSAAVLALMPADGHNVNAGQRDNAERLRRVVARLGVPLIPEEGLDAQFAEVTARIPQLRE